MENRVSFIHDEMTLKVLILFILRHISEPVPETDLTDVTLLCDDGIGYFEFTDCLHDLVSTGHIAALNGKYSVTEKGRQNGEATESSIPYSVRIRAERAAATLSQALSRSAMITASHELRSKGGFTVRLSMSDEVGEIMSLNLLCGDEKSVREIEENFRDNAEKIYGKVIEAVLEKRQA